MMCSYLILILLFAVPVAVRWFADLFYPDSAVVAQIENLWFISPFAATFSLPLGAGQAEEVLAEATAAATGSLSTVASFATGTAFVFFYVVVDLLLISVMTWLFNTRWRVAG
jgi:hypothetical protein